MAITLGAPMLAEAQQGGMFPLAPIRRERVACPMEDPVYGLYRKEYFGYHPTCWRQFPAGWGCPSADAPNAAAAFRARPRDAAPPVAPPDDLGEGPPDMGGAPPMGGGGAAPAPGGTFPPLPEERSPFQLDRPGGGGGAPAPRPGGQPPATTPPSTSNDPLSLPPSTGDAAPAPTGAPAGLSTGLLDSDEPRGNRMAPSGAPLPSLPEPPSLTPPTSNATLNSPPPVGMINDPGPSASTAPVQAPRRTSLIGGLFGGFAKRSR